MEMAAKKANLFEGKTWLLEQRLLVQRDMQALSW
jgi:hypothetical protein